MLRKSFKVPFARSRLVKMLPQTSAQMWCRAFTCLCLRTYMFGCCSGSASMPVACVVQMALHHDPPTAGLAAGGLPRGCVTPRLPLHHVAMRFSFFPDPRIPTCEPGLHSRRCFFLALLRSFSVGNSLKAFRGLSSVGAGAVFQNYAGSLNTHGRGVT